MELLLKKSALYPIIILWSLNKEIEKASSNKTFYWFQISHILLLVIWIFLMIFSTSLSIEMVPHHKNINTLHKSPSKISINNFFSICYCNKESGATSLIIWRTFEFLVNFINSIKFSSLFLDIQSLIPKTSFQNIKPYLKPLWWR